MCVWFHIQFLELIELNIEIGTNEKEGVTCVMMSNDYLFTSFEKLMKRAQNEHRECKRGFKFHCT